MTPTPSDHAALSNSPSDHAALSNSPSDHAALAPTPSDHAALGPLTVLAVPGLPEFRPGDDLVAAIAAAAPWLREDDVLVVTSKIVSKVEGRLVPAPRDPDERDTLRRKLVEQEAVRVLARRGRTLITEGRTGLVQAASGIDGSNVDTDELALLPEDPDASAARLRDGLAAALGIRVAVVLTDTMGRAWRVGQIDTAIGAAGLAVLHAYAGSHDVHGNELAVTEVAVADELAAAADLVKGKLGGLPVAVVRGLDPRPDGSTAADLRRPGRDDMFWLGTREAIAQGARDALLARRSVRRFSDAPVPAELVERAAAHAVTAPAPHHSHPVRFGWVRSPERRTALLDAMAARWRDDLTGDGRPADEVARRLARGDLLRDAPELLLAFWTADAAVQHYPDPARTAAEHTMFTAAAGAAVHGLLVALATDGLGACWVGSTIFAADQVREVLELPADWHPVGAIALGWPAGEVVPRPEPTPGDELVIW